MEILIIGVVLVALMAYVSTRIKKTSADAFESETIETDEFSLIKPEGYIAPTLQKSEVAFAARSRETGADAAEKLDQSWAYLRVLSARNFEEVCRRAEQSAQTVVSSETARDGDLRFCFMHLQTTQKETSVETFYKIVENSSRRKIYELQVSVLRANMENYGAKASAMLQSFTVK